MPHEPEEPGGLAQVWRRFWSTPDRLLVDAGAAGEFVVSWIRLLVVGVLVVIPLVLLMADRGDETAPVSLGIGVVALAFAAGVYLLVHRRLYRPWLGFVTSIADVTFISAVLVTLLVLDQPHAAVNSRIAYPLYFLAIAATALRYDARVCALAGLIATLEYAAVVAWADLRWQLNAMAWAPFTYGTFSWNVQYGRLVLLLMAGCISTVVVLRSQRLRRLAASDPLTGLINRGYFDERLEEEEIRARRYDRPLAVAMIDIDRFKQFNDTHGHANGDDALRTVASAIRGSIRRTDLVGRYGGEEFVVLFPETPPDAAVRKAEDIRQAVAAVRIPLRGRDDVAHVAVSIGVAGWPNDVRELDGVLERADRRLYEAKQTGRDRVVGPGGEPETAS